jgi:hypothetical protein
MDTIHMMASSFLGCLKVHSSNVEKRNSGVPGGSDQFRIPYGFVVRDCLIKILESLSIVSG